MAATVFSYIVNPGAGGKFVVMLRREDAGAGALVFSDFTRDFQHSDIVGRWRLDQRLTPEAAGYRVAGGGWWKYENPDFLVLYGQSAAYGRFDAGWVRSRLQAGMVGGETRLDVR